MKTLIKKNTVWVSFCGSSIVMLIIAIVVSKMMVSSAATIEKTSREHILALSRAAALLVTAEEMEGFVLPDDEKKPEYTALRYKLATFNEASGTEYTYFLRLDTETNMMQFIIDNTLEDFTALSLPKVPREYAPDVALSGTANTVEMGSYSEGWEGYMTAFAPVYYKDGRLSNVIAGVDMLDVNIREIQHDISQLSILLIISIIVALGACLYSLILYQQQAKAALLSNEAKSAFLSNTSHEIRTPMNAILGMVDLIIHENTSDTVRSYANDIRSACKGLLTIINDILDISKIEAGKLEIVPASYHISSLLVDTISIVKMRTDEKNITFAVNIDPNIPSELIGDEMRIKQVLVNLLNNAVKFTQEGQITLSVESHIENDFCRLFFSVEDTGIGIKPADMEKIFVLFQQVDTKKNRNIEGTGLGLSISKQLVEMMDGSLDVISEYGTGSTFTASIKQIIANAEPITMLKNPDKISVLVYENRPAHLNSVIYTLDSLDCNYEVCNSRAEIDSHLDDAKYDYLFISAMYIEKVQAVAAEKQPKAVIIVLDGDGTSYNNTIAVLMPIHCLQIANILNDEYADIASCSPTVSITAPEAKVLVVDDNMVNLKVAAGLLKIFAIQADTAVNGMRAVEMVRQTEYDLVFMDHMMPDMDGIDTTVAIRALGDEYANLPIVALTANAIGGVREMFKAEGLDDFLAKPIEMSKLNAILKKWLPTEKQIIGEAVALPETGYVEIFGLDTQKGIINSGGSTTSYNEILAIYAADCEGRLQDMAKHHKLGDLRALSICIHAIKSASANIGATDVSDMASALESAGKIGNAEYIDVNLSRFVSSISELLVNIRDYLSDIRKDDTVRDKPADFDFLKTSLEEIESHMESFDIDYSEKALMKLYAYQWSEDIYEVIYKIKNCIDMFDYDGISKAVSTLKEMLEENL